MTISLNITQEDLDELILNLKREQEEASQSEVPHVSMYRFDILENGEKVGLATFMLPLNYMEELVTCIDIELDGYKGKTPASIVSECSVFAVEKLGAIGKIDVRVS